MSENTPDDNDLSRYLPAKVLLPVLTAEDGSKVPLNSLLQLDPQNLLTEYGIHAPWHATVSWGYYRQQVETERAKRELSRTEAQLYLDHRTRLGAGAARAPSAELVKSWVEVDPRLEEAQERYFAAMERLGAWRAASEAMQSRRECLISMGAEVRRERGH